PIASAPYLSFSLATPMITLSAPLRGKVTGVIAADLKLDSFSEFVHAQRPGEHGAALLFDRDGTVIAHPSLANLVERPATNGPGSSLPNVRDVKDPLIQQVIRLWDGRDRFEGTIQDSSGENFFFRLLKFSFGKQYSGYLLLLAAQDDFVKEISAVQIKA